MSHLDHGRAPTEYKAYLTRKIWLLYAGFSLMCLLLVADVCLGSVMIPLDEVLKSLFGIGAPGRFHAVIWNIRLPNALTAVLAGAGLAAAGAAMQSFLRNPLASPITLGISHAGAFGAAFAVMFMGAGVMQSTSVNAVSVNNPALTSIFSFISAMSASLAIVLISRLRGGSPEAMILCGAALNSLFMAGIMFLQYFASDLQLAAMVFWTFGDLARAGWRDVGIMAFFTLTLTLYFIWNRWNYNALDAGDETARGLGVRVGRVRLLGMIAATLLTSVIVSTLGVIGFVGLISPHMVRRALGDDHRYLLPGSCLLGALLLLAGDIGARLALAPRLLPVSVVTALIGAPTFLYLLVRGGRR